MKINMHLARAISANKIQARIIGAGVSQVHPILLCALGLALCVSSCKKNGSPAQPATLAISNMSPFTGPFGTVVTIRGTGFSANVADDSVWFDGVPAVVQKATATQLTVVVPFYAGAGPVAVAIAGGGAAVTGPFFNYIYSTYVSTFAGSGNAGLLDGRGLNVKFNQPKGISLDAGGNIYVADYGNNAIRVIDGPANTGSGYSFTVAGSSAAAGFADGSKASAKFNGPMAVAVDSTGTVFVADAGNFRIRKIASGTVSTLAGGASVPGYGDGPGTSARFASPSGLARDPKGNLYVADLGNYLIRLVSPAGTTSTVAGNNSKGLVNGASLTAQFGLVSGMALDANGNLFVADASNNVIREITAAGIVSTYAGAIDGSPGYADGESGSSRFNNPVAVTIDAQGNLFVADAGNHLIRKISASGIVSTLAGMAGKAGYMDGLPGVAQFDDPSGIAVDENGNVFVADTGNNRIRIISQQ